MSKPTEEEELGIERTKGRPPGVQPLDGGNGPPPEPPAPPPPPNQGGGG